MREKANQNRGKDVLLISMPWTSPLEPSIGVCVLKQVLLDANINCDILEAHNQLLRWVKYGTYDGIATQYAMCDFAFTSEFEKEISGEQRAILKTIQKKHAWIKSDIFEKIVKLREHIIPIYLDELMKLIDLSKYCMVGFTCVSDQTFASLALAKRIREACPDMLLAYGGYGMHDPVGSHLMEVFPELMDVICVGDGEPTIVKLAEAACGHRSLSEVPNLIYRREDGTIQSTQEITADIEQSPTPCYDDYVQQKNDLWDRHKLQIDNRGVFPVEGSRGCWWGEHTQCVFCGIDGNTMKYKNKSSDRILSQLDELHEKYGARRFRFSDSNVSPEFITELLPILKGRGKPYRLHFEYRADLDDEKMDLLRDSGVVNVQLGIESFGTSVLRRMRKGVSGLNNIRVIHGLMSRGVVILYNILYGFPGETVEEYRALVAMTPALSHLVPPNMSAEVLVTRHSPLAENPKAFGFDGDLKVNYRYNICFTKKFYEENNLDMSKVCYYFDQYFLKDVTPGLRRLYGILEDQHVKWKKEFFKRPVYLSYKIDNDGITFRDTRMSAQERVIQLSVRHADVYKTLVASVLAFEKLKKVLPDMSSGEIDQILEDLVRERVIIHEDGRYLGIAFHERLCKEGQFFGGTRWKSLFSNGQDTA